jgi:aspartate aminotransferase-like enzyme
VLILTASGTGGLEAAIVNTLSPGDRVLAVTVGAFGDRFADIAEAYGAAVDRLAFTWGEPADPDVVAERLRSGGPYAAVLLTHNETSTGITNDLEALCAVARQAPGEPLLLVDAISSLGAIDLPTDRWGCDVVITGSQKAWMIPPGLTMASVGPRAWAAYRRARMPRFYFDFGKAQKSLEKKQTPFTPAVSLLYALKAGLDLLRAEGLPGAIARHRRIGERTRSGVKGLGLELFARESHASNTVTAVRVPAGVEGSALRKALRERHGVVLAGGQGKIADQVFRIGHLGYVSEADIDDVLAALAQTLERDGSTWRIAQHRQPASAR